MKQKTKKRLQFIYHCFSKYHKESLAKPLYIIHGAYSAAQTEEMMKNLRSLPSWKTLCIIMAVANLTLCIIVLMLVSQRQNNRTNNQYTSTHVICDENFREQDIATRYISASYVEPGNSQIGWQKIGHMALAACHRGRTKGHARILLVACGHVGPTNVYRDLTMIEVYKYIAKEAYISVLNGEAGTNSAVILASCVYLHKVPVEKIDISLTLAKIQCILPISDEAKVTWSVAKEEASHYCLSHDIMPRLSPASETAKDVDRISTPMGTSRTTVRSSLHSALTSRQSKSKAFNASLSGFEPVKPLAIRLIEKIGQSSPNLDQKQSSPIRADQSDPQSG